MKRPALLPSAIATAIMVPATATGFASAQSLHDTDLVIGLDDTSTIVLANNADAVEGTFGQRVFVGQLSTGGTADDPGFDSFSGTFPGGMVLRYDIVGALQQWNGSAFDAETADSTMSVFKFGIERQTPQDDSTVEGVPFGQTDSAGRFHHHVDFELNTPPASGIYLLGLQLVPTNQPAVIASEPFWVVWDFNAENTEVEQARDWALANIVPNPCAIDWNDDQIVNVLDVIAFITTWNTQGTGADFNNDGGINVLDVISFITNFNAGCP